MNQLYSPSNRPPQAWQRALRMPPAAGFPFSGSAPEGASDPVSRGENQDAN